MSESNSSPPPEASAASPPTGEPEEEHPAVLETPVEVVSTRIHYQAPPPPYSAVKNAPTEEANLLTNSITITIKCPSCLGFLAGREMKTIVPVATLVSETTVALASFGKNPASSMNPTNLCTRDLDRPPLQVRRPVLPVLVQYWGSLFLDLI